MTIYLNNEIAISDAAASFAGFLSAQCHNTLLEALTYWREDGVAEMHAEAVAAGWTGVEGWLELTELEIAAAIAYEYRLDDDTLFDYGTGEVVTLDRPTASQLVVYVLAVECEQGIVPGGIFGHPDRTSVYLG